MRYLSQERSGAKTAMWLAQGTAFASHSIRLGPATRVPNDLPHFVHFIGEHFALGRIPRVEAFWGRGLLQVAGANC